MRKITQHGKQGRKKRLKATARTFRVIAAFGCVLTVAFGGLFFKTARGAEPNKNAETPVVENAELLAVPRAARPQGETPPASGGLSGVRVLIDPGHGDTDVGTIGPNTGRYEKEVNLEISLKLKAALEQKGAVVLMTREDDGPLGPADEQDVGARKEADMCRREEIIENAGAQLMVSIHQNRFDDPAVRGAQVFYLKREDNGQEYGVDFAQAIQGALNEDLGVSRPRSINGGNWRLLKKGGQPGCIVECGFFSNPEEEALLQTGEYQDKTVAAIVRGMESYALEYGV